MPIRSVTVAAAILSATALAATAVAATAVAATAVAASGLAPGDRVENFGLLDHRGQSHELYYLSDMSAVVIMAHSETCPASVKAADRLAASRTAHAGEKVEFLLLRSAPENQPEISA